MFAGLPDPGETRVALQTAADRDAGAMAAVLRGLTALDPAGRGLTAAEVVDAVRPAGTPHAEPRAAVEDLCGRLGGRTLGYRFRHFQRRKFGGLMLGKAGAAHGSNKWVVVPVGPRRVRPGEAGCDGGAGPGGGHGGDGGHGPPRPGDDATAGAAGDGTIGPSRPPQRFASDDRPFEPR